MELTQIPQNYKSNVDWIIKAYEDAGVTFPNGFQKDAIQNAAGARKGKNWKNWRCDLYYVENEKGSFLVIEDSGTCGLTGKNLNTKDVDKIMASGESLPPTERLSRFTSMFNSGGNESGAGLYGAGKSVYSIASQNYIYYFDSLREDGLYVANINNTGRVHPVAFEDEEAKKFIYTNTGLSQKKTTGTRIIIKNPKSELIEAIK